MKKSNVKCLAMGLSAALASCSLAAAPLVTARMDLVADLQPSTCGIALGGGGTASFGTLSPGAISSSATGTVLANPQTVALTITCDGATQVAFGAKDARADSLVPSLTAAWTMGMSSGQPTSPANAFGLGTKDGARIGAYTLAARNFSVDGTPALASSVSLTSGMLVPSVLAGAAVGVYPVDTSGLLTTWASSSTSASTGMTFTAELVVAPTINQSRALPLGKRIDLDGCVTLTIYWL